MSSPAVHDNHKVGSNGGQLLASLELSGIASRRFFVEVVV